MPATWKAFGVDADDDGHRDPANPRDAIFAAARYLDASGGRERLRHALYAYNHALWYVEAVLLRAEMIGPKEPLITELLLQSGARLERSVLEDERISIYDCGRQDIRKHRVDRRVLVLLKLLASSDLHPGVTSLRCGHSAFTKSGNISHHWFGSAVDIATINGESVMGHQTEGSDAERAVRLIVTLRGLMKPAQIISLMKVEGAAHTLVMGDHADHLHVGFRPAKNARTRKYRRLAHRIKARAKRRDTHQLHSRFGLNRALRPSDLLARGLAVDDHNH